MAMQTELKAKSGTFKKQKVEPQQDDDDAVFEAECSIKLLELVLNEMHSDSKFEDDSESDNDDVEINIDSLDIDNE